jgi:magnesium-protoporphyrin O-methyltransferase
MMQGFSPAQSYQKRRGEIENYFDRTAMAAWEKLTSNAPVSGIRATVRAGRDEMRNTLLSWLPENLQGMRLLDAGCGTGALALAAAARGAEVVAIDLSPQLVKLAAERAADHPAAARIRFCSGDMLDPELGRFDYGVAMDSIIHYRPEDTFSAIAQLAARCNRALLFTFAPGTPLLRTALAVGKILPRGNRSPAIVPQSEAAIRAAFNIGRSRKISSGFYTSQAMEVLK